MARKSVNRGRKPAKRVTSGRKPAKRVTRSSPTVRTPGYVQWKYETASQYRDAGGAAGKVGGAIRRRKTGQNFLPEQPGKLSRGDARRHRVQGPINRSAGNTAGNIFAREQQRQDTQQWKKAARRGYTGLN